VLNCILFSTQHIKKEESNHMKQRAADIDQRVRQSERFPRIRDAELEMAVNEAAFLKRREDKKKAAEKLKRLKAFQLPDFRPDAVKPVVVKQEDYFTGFVINNDADSAKYMDFNEIFYPKLFNPSSSKAPHSIDSVWMLALAHESHNANKVKLKKPGINEHTAE
jgi:hypothetical protein